MKKKLPSTTQDVIALLDNYAVQLRHFPLSKRPYRELYELVTASLGFLDDVVCRREYWEGVTSGLFGDDFHVEYKSGMVFNHLYVDMFPVQEKGVIYIMERKLFLRQPVLARWYEYDGVTGERVFQENAATIDLDQATSFFNSNYEKTFFRFSTLP